MAKAVLGMVHIGLDQISLRFGEALPHTGCSRDNAHYLFDYDTANERLDDKFPYPAG